MSDRKKSGGKKIVVPLKLISDAIEMADSGWKQYLDIEKMEVVSLPETLFAGEYDEEDQALADLIEEEWHVRFFGLPSQFDIHEYEIMERFIWDLPQGAAQDTLERAVQGKGAFRRFRDNVRRFGLEEQWYDFQKAAYRRQAIEWCESHGFGYSGGEHLQWQEIRREHIVQDEWIDFRRSTYRLPDGSEFGPFYSYSRRDYVVIVASDEDGNYICVRQFRPGIGKVTTEFPAGGIERKDGREYEAGRSGGAECDRLKAGGAGSRSYEAGCHTCGAGSRTCGAEFSDSAVEDALEAARRELLEETGYESHRWSHLLTVHSNATIADNYAFIFAAEDCRRAGKPHLDATEFLEVKKYSAAEIEEMIQKGSFQQVVHIMAWLLLQRKKSV